MVRSLIVTLLMVCVGSSAVAGTYATTRLHNGGAWTVEETHDTGGEDRWCVARTVNGRGQTFDLTAYDSGFLMIFLHDPRWATDERRVSFQIDIDKSRWDLTGTASEDTIFVSVGNSQSTIRFLRKLMAGTAVSLYDERGDRLGRFSLDGSGVAIRSVVNCWDRIAVRPASESEEDPS